MDLVNYNKTDSDEKEQSSVFTAPQLTMLYFENWKTTLLTCSVCLWRGMAEPLRMTHNDSELYPESSFSCPNCRKKLLTVEHTATMVETIANLDKLSSVQRSHILEVQKSEQEILNSALKDGHQLPDLSSGSKKLIWDIEQDQDKIQWNIIKHDAHVLWRQRASWEGATEFARIISILSQRYGKDICDLEPTDLSLRWLCGDSFQTQGIVENARRRLGWRRLP